MNIQITITDVTQSEMPEIAKTLSTIGASRISVKAQAELPFPEGLEPDRPPPSGHRWVYQGMGVSLPEGHYLYRAVNRVSTPKWLTGMGPNDANTGFHYALAVPLSESAKLNELITKLHAENTKLSTEIVRLVRVKETLYLENIKRGSEIGKLKVDRRELVEVNDRLKTERKAEVEKLKTRFKDETDQIRTHLGRVLRENKQLAEANEQAEEANQQLMAQLEHLGHEHYKLVEENEQRREGDDQLVLTRACISMPAGYHFWGLGPLKDRSAMAHSNAGDVIAYRESDDMWQANVPYIGSSKTIIYAVRKGTPEARNNKLECPVFDAPGARPALPKLFDLPQGFHHWEYRGMGWSGNNVNGYAYLFPSVRAWQWNSMLGGAPVADADTHYA